VDVERRITNMTKTKEICSYVCECGRHITNEQIHEELPFECEAEWEKLRVFVRKNFEDIRYDRGDIVYKTCPCKPEGEIVKRTKHFLFILEPEAKDVEA
jgi:hypothetical protein